jgi:hypothetical protein
MPAPIMKLGGTKFTLAELRPGIYVDDEALNPLADVVRSEGLQRLQSLLSHQKIVLPPPVNGFGLPKILSGDIDNSAKLARSSESHVETRWVPTTLARGTANSTEPTLADHTLTIPRVSIEFLNELVWIWDGTQDSDSDGFFYPATYGGSGTTWGTATAGSAANVTNPSVALDATVDQDTMIVLWAMATYHRTSISTAITSGWTASTTEPTVDRFANAISAGENIDGGRIENISGVGSYVITWDEKDKVADIFKTTNKGVDFTATAAAIASAPNGIHGSAVYFDLNGDVAPVFVTDAGVWAWDTSADVAHLLASLPSSKNNGRATTVWANPFIEGGRPSLYVGLGDGRLLELTFISTTTGFRKRIYDMNFHGALDADREGHFVRFAATNQWLYFSYGGHASGKKAWIGAFDGRGTNNPNDPSEGFHHIFQHDTGNLEIDMLALSNRDDDTPRLHYNIRLTATSENTEFIANPDAPPTGPVAITSLTSGVLDRPRIDGGLPANPAAWLAVFSDTDTLGTTSTEFINLDYGVNGAAPTTDLGNIVSGTQTLQFVSGAGIEGREIQIRENYTSNDGAATPKGYGIEIDYDKRINKLTAGNDNSDSLRKYTVVVDIEQTAADGQALTPQDVLQSLFDLEGSITLPALDLADIGIAANLRYVRVKLPRLAYGMPATALDYAGGHTSFKTVAVEMSEII